MCLIFLDKYIIKEETNLSWLNKSYNVMGTTNF